MTTAAALVAGIQASGRIGEVEVLAARRMIYGDDGAVGASDLDLLFAMDGTDAVGSEQWVALFAEAMTDHFVHQLEPRGYIDAHNAADLMARISRDGIVTAATELEALIKCLEAAHSAPVELSAFALRQVAMAVVDGAGPLARGGRLEPGRVNREEAELMRRILSAGGGVGGHAVTRAEAEVLFDINDRTAAASNDPAWADVFVRSIASCIVAASGYQPPRREDALRREAWLDDTTNDGVGSFFGRMISGGLSGVLDAWRKDSTVEGAFAEKNRQMAEAAAMAAVVTDDEATWLADRMGRDGVMTANETALLAFIREDSPRFHPRLAELAAKAA